MVEAVDVAGCSINHRKHGGIISNYNRANDLAGNRLIQWLMSPSPKSQGMFASAFS